MRSYQLNSPKAAARIVAITLFADGHLSDHEHEALTQHNAAGLLGLESDDMEVIVRHLAEDLQAFGVSFWSGTGLLDEACLTGVLREVTDPHLRSVILDICATVIHADSRGCEFELAIVDFTKKAWGVESVQQALMH